MTHEETRPKVLADLAELLSTRFDGPELSALCYQLGIDYEDLPAQMLF